MDVAYDALLVDVRAAAADAEDEVVMGGGGGNPDRRLLLLWPKLVARLVGETGDVK